MPMFAKHDNIYKVVGTKKEHLRESLDTGMYTAKIYETPRGTIERDLTPMSRYDNSKVIKAGVFEEAYDYITEYFDPIKLRLRKEMGMMNKMNVMFKGDPGTGKTHLACTIASEIIRKNNGIGIVIDNIMEVDFDTLSDDLRINDDPNRLIVIVLDELEKNKDWVLNRAKFLGFLDGALSKSNVFVFATVNSIDNLPDYLTNRPGRFEKIYNFNFKDKEVLRTITKGIAPKQYKENAELIDTIVDIAFSEEISTIDHLRFFILDYLFKLEKGLPLPTVKVEEIDDEDDEANEEVLETVDIPLSEFSTGEVKYEEIATKVLEGMKKGKLINMSDSVQFKN
jgi:hypothetical protein